MPRLIKILIVEDSANDAELIELELRRSALNFECKRVDTREDYLAALDTELDLILSDYSLQGFDALCALELLREKPALDIPFIVISGTIGEETAVEIMRLGAADYLLKDRLGRLGPAVRRALHEVNGRRERKNLEAQFVEAQKMEVIGQLAGGVAHDFNNVLGVILGYSDLIASDFSSNHALISYIDEIRHAAKRAAGLTQQLLIFSRKQTVKAEILDPNEVIEGMQKMLRRLIDENIELVLVCQPGIGQIKVDSGYLWQVMMNMSVNARDAMPEGGKLTIQTSSIMLDRGAKQIQTQVVPGKYVRISVSDTGIGMTEETRKKIFEAFFTTKPAGKGTGLGLATCQTIVQQAGGYIGVSSELGKGTTFQIYFPQVAETATKTASLSLGSLSEPGTSGTETLLVVEDDPSLRNLARGILRGQGYRVMTASNGQDALAVAREHPGPPIDLVITDVVMPRMNGKVMAAWLKDSFPDLKILFTSGYSDSMTNYDEFEDDVEFLAKPYSSVELARKVRKLLDRPNGK